jgi:hypothetical protein
MFLVLPGDLRPVMALWDIQQKAECSTEGEGERRKEKNKRLHCTDAVPTFIISAEQVIV